MCPHRRSASIIHGTLALLMLLSFSPARAQDVEDLSMPKLGINDPAPPLQVDGWSTGEAIEKLQEGKIYVVEFWATWCPPCRTSMPHLSQLQEQYGDEVTIIGVTRENESTVAEFLERDQSEGKTWKDVVKYRLALDASGGPTNTAYMRAAGQSGIPAAFIVGKDGRVEWIGHPMAIDRPLAKVVAGEWDRDAAIAEFQQAQADGALMRVLSGLARGKEWDAALAKLDEADEKYGKSAARLSLRVTILRMADRPDEVPAVQESLVEAAWDDARMLNAFAWSVATGRGDRDLDLAHKAAKRAVELTEQKDAAFLDTLARVCFEQKDLPQAIQWQKQAVEVNAGANPEIDVALKRYEEAATGTKTDE